MHIMTVKTATGPLYDVDLRLRPSGSSGLIVCSMQGYADYLKQDAWTWEHQALVRARCILGSSEIHQQFSEIRYDRLENGQHKQNLKLAISQMRQKMRDNTSVQLNDFKHCPGGLIDIEFLVQYWIMQHIQDFPELAKWSDNVRQLKSLVSLKIISKDDTCTLLSTYIDLRNHMHHSALAEAPLPAAEVLLNNIAAVEKIWQRNFSEC
jgi:glutamate-ammonia-ligase adenylyltransferase